MEETTADAHSASLSASAQRPSGHASGQTGAIPQRTTHYPPNRQSRNTEVSPEARLTSWEMEEG